MKNNIIAHFAVYSFILLLTTLDLFAGADFHGVWNAQFSTVHKVSMLGKVKWIQITFLEGNKVEWTWEREGKFEKHKGKYSLSADAHKSGVRPTSRIALNSETLSVYRNILLLKAVIDHDNRFALSQKVLKCQDNEGNDLVFSRSKPK